MPPVPVFAQLAGVPREALWGLVGAYGEAPRAATYEYAWQRDRATWQAVERALSDAARGVRVADSGPPRWLEPLTRRRLADLSGRAARGSDLVPVRLLERAGLVSLEADDTWVLAVVSGLGVGEPGGRLAALREDPELRQRLLWRLFEVEGGGEVSLANVDRFDRDGPSWRATLVQLVDDGTVPRDRVRRACLTTLGGDFSSYRAAWYAGLHAALAPTTDELAADQALLRALLRSDVPTSSPRSCGCPPTGGSGRWTPGGRAAS